MKRLKPIYIILIIVFAIIFLYFYAIHPIICKLYIIPDIYTGLEIYQTEYYLQHEDGYTFKQYFTALDYYDEGEVVDFYYGDNESLDNPIHGKACDVFSIDIQLPEKRYQEVVSAIVACGQYDPYPDDYDKPENEKWKPKGFVIWQPIALCGDKCNFVYATNNKQRVVRVIMVTDTEEFEGHQLRGIIENRSTLFND